MPHAAAKSVPTISNPVRFSATPVDYRSAPPLLGQHTEAILRDELGYSDREIGALREAGAI
jgi:crotonobetainyl-CoA:carnitine CoA-transferase CaiB-like acyl-CoA transferase